MSKREEYESRTTQLLEPIIKETDYELVDVEYVKEGSSYYLRVYLDKPDGITIDDCEIVSRALGDKLDEEDFVEDSYILEVSSPGLGRPLKKEKDFQRSIGKEIEIHLYSAIYGQKDFRGYLKSFTKETITIAIDEEEQTLERKDIASVKLAFDF